MRAFLSLALLTICTALLVTEVGANNTRCAPIGGGVCGRYVIASGAFPDKECIQGEFYLDTDETVDTNCTTQADNSICVCVAKNTWLAVNNTPTTTSTTTTTTTTSTTTTT